MIGEMTRMAFESWFVTDEAWERYGELRVLNNEDYDNPNTMKTRLMVAKKVSDAIGGAHDVRAVLFRGDGADDTSLPQFETRFAHGRIESRFGELSFELSQIDALPYSEDKLAFKDFVRLLRDYARESFDGDFQSVMLYLRSRSFSVRKPTKNGKLYAVRVTGDHSDHPRSELLPWAFPTASRAKSVMGRLAESVVPHNWEKYRILVDRDRCVVDKLPRRQENEYAYHPDEDEHLALSVESVEVPKDFAAVPNADGDWFVGSWDLMRTKAWDTRRLGGLEWLDRINPYYYRDHKQLEDHGQWSLLAEEAAAKCDWWKIDVATLDIWQWLYVLRFRSDFADACPYWAEFDPFQWSFLLRRQPKFAERCNRFNEFWPELWSFLLSRQPQFADRCSCWDDMSPFAWERMLRDQPQLLARIDLGNADGDLWAKVVKHCPEHASDCPWDKLSDGAWADLLPERPEFAEYCDFEKFDSWSWKSLLSAAPQFVGRCDITKISAYDWYCILDAQPQLAGYFKKWHELEEAQQFKLLQKSPHVCQCVEFATLPLKTRINYLLLRPEFAGKMNWQDVVDKGDWYRLLACIPECIRYAPADAVKPEALGRVWLGRKGPVVVIPRPYGDYNGSGSPFTNGARERVGQYRSTHWGVTYEGRKDYRDEMSRADAEKVVDRVLGTACANAFAIDIEGVFITGNVADSVATFAEILKDWFAYHESDIKVVHLECGNLYHWGNR